MATFSRVAVAESVINDSKETTKSETIKANETQDLNVENPFNNGVEKTTGASQQYFTISAPGSYTMRVIP